MSTTQWQDLHVSDRLTAVTADILSHAQFAVMAGVACVGKVHVGTDVPTAATDGEHEYYNEGFMQPLDREQTRYIKLHETGHKWLKHCSAYRTYFTKSPDIANIAADHAVNHMIEEIDGGQGFVRRPTPDLFCDPKYRGWSFVRIFLDLLKQNSQQQQSGKGNPGKSGGKPGTGMNGTVLDEHRQSQRTPTEEQQLAHKVDAAIKQGKDLADKLMRKAGNTGGGYTLGAVAIERYTDWRTALFDFIQTVTAGDDLSRYVPPNRRLRGLDMIFPSHFTESMGELVIAADTSGSMSHVMPAVLGEVARVCLVAPPALVHLLWWDTAVRSCQTFTPDQYASIASAMHPEGGGGTTPEVVATYLDENKSTINPCAVLWLTDGEFYGDHVPTLRYPQLWGVFGNDQFVPPAGKVVPLDI